MEYFWPNLISLILFLKNIQKESRYQRAPQRTGNEGDEYMKLSIFQRLLSAFHNCSRSLLHLLSNSGSYQWPAQAQPFWLRNHVFFHSMNHVLGFGFQQCSLRLRKPKLVERELPAERLVSFCSYLEKLQALQIPNRCWEICLFWNANTTRTWTSSNNLLTQRKQNLSQATWSGSNNLAHTYLLLVAVELQHQEQLMSEIWGRVANHQSAKWETHLSNPFLSIS